MHPLALLWWWGSPGHVCTCFGIQDLMAIFKDLLASILTFSVFLHFDGWIILRVSCLWINGIVTVLWTCRFVSVCCVVSVWVCIFCGCVSVPVTNACISVVHFRYCLRCVLLLFWYHVWPFMVVSLQALYSAFWPAQPPDFTIPR